MRVFSYGGGVQSTAVLVLAAQGKLHYDSFLFANVGDDSENPGTIEYIRDVAVPYAKQNGVVLEEVRRTYLDGTPYASILQHVMTTSSIRIPVYMEGGAPGRRGCTNDWKRNVIAKWLKQRGATKENPATMGLGISIDEYQRMRTDSGIAWELLEYPLIDLRMNRLDCRNVITRAGLDVPPKSSCWFCPYHRTGEWKAMRRDQPELYEKSVQLEKFINDKRTAAGKDRVYLSTKLIPLDQIEDAPQMSMFEEDACESGYCMV